MTCYLGKGFMSRRTAIQCLGVAAGALAAGGCFGLKKSGKLGIVSYSIGYRFGGFSEIANRRKEKRPFDAAGLIEYTATLGLKCLQIQSNMLDSLDRSGLDALRKKAETLGVELEMAGPNVSYAGMEQVVKTAQILGMTSFRVTLGMMTRAQGVVKNAADWNDFRAKAIDNLKKTADLVERIRIPLLLENHTDITTAEMMAILEEVGHQRVGVAMDFGNQLLVAEDPLEAVRTLAPYAGSTHLKDWALNPTEDGCTVSMVKLGTGVLKLPAMMDVVRKARPETNIVIEMLGDQTLPIPFRKDDWWQGFPGRKDREEATRMLEEMVAKSPAYTSPDYQTMSEADALAYEADTLNASIHYARSTLGITG